jgi:hypothetical protein
MEGSDDEDPTYIYTLGTVNYDVTLSIVTYNDGGRRGIKLTTVSGEPFGTATVNLPDAELEPDEVCIKTWGGNEGMLDFLVRNGIVEPTGRTVQTGFVDAPVCKLIIHF